MKPNIKKSIVVHRCERLAHTLESLGYRDRISDSDLRYWISYTIGGDPRTVQRYLERLTTLGYIQDSPTGRIWMLNLNPQRMVPVGQRLILEVESEEPP